MGTMSPSAEHPVESSVFRAALRRERIAAREALPLAQRQAFAARIERGLDELFGTRAPGVLAFCTAVRGEFDATAWVGRRLQQGWQAAMPVVVAAAAPMCFRAWTPQAPMARDRHGLPIPAAGAELRPDVILLPLVAFDAANYRLGYGGGYFDRTLAALAPRPLTIGIGYELARVASIFPETHDIPLDAIVTEAGIFAGSAE